MRHRLGNTRSLALIVIAFYVIIQIFVLFPMVGKDIETMSFLNQPNHAELGETEPDIPIDLENEIRKNLDYVKSIPDTERRLIFVHLPKTAGNTMVSLGFDSWTTVVEF